MVQSQVPVKSLQTLELTDHARGGNTRDLNNSTLVQPTQKPFKNVKEKRLSYWFGLLTETDRLIKC